MQIQDKSFTYGSQWVKADFHLHTHKDREFNFVNNTEYPDDNIFPSKFVEKLKTENIKIGVITNHNKFDKDEYCAIRKKAQETDILVLPGVELSIAEGRTGLHILICFSPNWISDGKDSIQLFLQGMFPTLLPTEFQSRNEHSEFGLIDTIQKLDEYNLDYFIVFAHVNQKNGLFEELTFKAALNLLEHLKDKVFAFQKCNTKTVEQLKQAKFDCPPLVEGTDSKSIEEMGKENRQCWLKIGTNTFDAVFLALKEYKEHVSLVSPNALNRSYINKISYSGGFLDGCSINLSPELNSFIGIRGSGKSAILETLNYGLDLLVNENRSDESYKKELLNYALGSGGKITIEVKDTLGHSYEIKRTYKRDPEVYCDGVLKPGIKINETVLYRPLYFGQKELAGRSEHFDSSLIDKLIGDKLLEYRQSIGKKKLEIITDVEGLDKLKNLENEKKTIEDKISNYNFKLEMFDAFKVKDRLQKQTDFESDNREIKKNITKLETLLTIIDNSISKIESINIECKLSENSKVYEDMIKTNLSIINVSKDSLTSLKDKIKGQIDLASKIYEKFNEEKKKYNDEFDIIKRNIESEIRSKGYSTTLQLDDYLTIQNQIALEKSKLSIIENKVKLKEQKQTQLDLHLSEIVELWRLEYQAITKELNKINSSQNSIVLKSEFEGEKNEFYEFLKRMFRGTGITQEQYKTFVNKYNDGIEMYNNFKNVLLIINSSTVKSSFETEFFNNLKEIITYQVPNKYSIMYKGKDISTLSLGQRASAMILFILGQKDNNVIIIDQPEDDLDNQTIYEEVIKILISLKPEMQFIFATHNANIPVLGDSEMVHYCSALEVDNNSHINVYSGSIDNSIIQNTIVDVMEGGKEAFKRRKEIYELWTN